MIKGFFVKDNRITKRAYILLAILPVVMALFSLSIGRMTIGIRDIVDFLYSYFKGLDYDPMIESVIINIRLPRVLTALFVGSGLAAAGLTFQGVFSNPLATPDILGVSSAASLGAIVGILLSLPSLQIQILALIFGLFGVFFTLNISNTENEPQIITLILSGLVVTSLSNAISSLLKYTADPTEKLPTITYWLMGSFARASYRNLLLSAPFIIIGVLLIRSSIFRLNIMSLSEDEARSLGVDVKKTRLLFIFGSTLITASATALCGQIGWVGLIIPHISRMIVGSNNNYNLPLTLSFGASLMVLIEGLSRSISVIELPISILTAIIGAPIFVSLIRKTGGGFR